MNKRNQKITFYFVILSLLVVGVVYAILQANLQINGIAKIKSNSWDIHFNNIVVNENSVSIGENDSPATIDPENNCKVDFEVTLSLPGDFYEFTVDVVNAGTIDGMIGEINKIIKVNNEIVSEVPDYLEYSVTYEDDSEILENQLLEKNTQKTYRVRLEFKTDIEELPDATTISSSFGVQYIQAEETIENKKPYNPCTYGGELVQGAEYTNGQYTYRYMQDYKYNNSTSSFGWVNITNDGWGVRISDPTSTEPVTTKLCTTIDNKPIVSMHLMFYESQTTSIDTSSFDTSNVVTMAAMFRYCTNITEIDISGFVMDNISSMSDLNGMLQGATSLKKVVAKNWVIPGSFADGFFRMMYGEGSIEEIDVTGWDLSNTTNISGLFGITGSGSAGGTGLKRIIGFDTWNTSNITNMSNLFYGLTSLEKIDLSSFDMSNVTNTDNMFYSCTSVTTAYGRTNSDITKLNASLNKPSNITFVVKS